MLKRLLLVITVFLLVGGTVQAKSIRLLMESVTGTRYIQKLLPQFKAETGIDVEMEVISYFDMFGTVIQGQRGDCISMQWSNYLYSQGGQHNDSGTRP